ncbi:MAG TPA: sulfatase-like hydrolase/transferase [Acidimicrobiia bacterium]
MSLERLGSVRWWIVPLSLATIAAFAFGQPILDLLGNNPDFFIAIGMTPTDVILFPFAVLILPMVLAIPILALRWVGASTAGLAHAIAIGILFSLLAASTWITLLGGDPPVILFAVVCLGAGSAFAIEYTRYPLIQSTVTFLSLALIVFAGWFLLMTPANSVAFANSSDLPEIGDVANPVPVVLVVFDEFPVASMIDSEGSLLTKEFPSFGALAADSVWYRNAVGVRQQTQEALPTILTGVGAELGDVPTSADYPLNLFTLFSDSYDIAAMETITSLCPSFACANSSRRIDPTAQRWGGMAVDLAVIYGHVTLPADISDHLPPINQMWGNFTSGERTNFDMIDRFMRSVEDDRREEVSRFLNILHFDSAEPSLRFGHFLFPHHPWLVTADGQLTGVTYSPGSEGDGWGMDNWLIGQGYQRHLLQAQYSDTILGQSIDRLKQEGVYDDALVIVLADHGVTIRAGTENERTMTPDTVGTIAAVPLFVKYPSGFPGVEPGTIDDIRAETMDIMPTIAEVVGITVPWDMDGFSLLDPESRATRTESVMIGKQGTVNFGVSGKEKLDAAAEKEEWFPDGDPWSLTPPGWSEWPGRSLADLDARDVPEISIKLEQQGLLDDLGQNPEVLPTFLSGRVTLDEAATGSEIVVIAVDGVVRAVTRTFDPTSQSAKFQVMIAPEWLHQGSNDVIAWLAVSDSKTSALVR